MSNENTNPESDKVEDVNTEVEETEEVDEVEEDEADDYTPSKGEDAKYTKADIDRAVERRQAALKERNEARKEKARLAKELRELKKQNETDAEKAAREAEEAKLAAFEEASNKYKPALVKNYIEKELVSAGVKPGKVARLVRLMDIEDISVDNDFNVVGVEEQIDELKEEYPELFHVEKPKEEDEEEEKPKRRRRAPKADASDKPAPKQEVTATEKLMSQLRSGRR